MGYYDYDNPGEGQAARAAPARGVLGTLQAIVALLVRLLGMGLIGIGLAIGISIVLEAWELYKAPERIDRFAVAIEQGSNIDSAFRSLADKASEEAAGEAGEANSEGQRRARAAASTGPGGFRLSYFAAWVIVLALMLVVGMLAMSAASTGARLALGPRGGV